VALLIGLIQPGRLHHGAMLSDALGVLLVFTTVVFFIWLLFVGAGARWSASADRRRSAVPGLSLFWCMFEQAGSTLNLFAQRSTRNSVFGFAFPASWLQAMTRCLSSRWRRCRLLW